MTEEVGSRTTCAEESKQETTATLPVGRIRAQADLTASMRGLDPGKELSTTKTVRVEPCLAPRGGGLLSSQLLCVEMLIPVVFVMLLMLREFVLKKDTLPLVEPTRRARNTQATRMDEENAIGDALTTAPGSQREDLHRSFIGQSYLEVKRRKSTGEAWYAQIDAEYNRTCFVCVIL